MATNQQNIAAIGDHATTAQALSLNHSTRIGAGGKIEAVYISDEWFDVDTIAFADYAESAINASATAPTFGANPWIGADGQLID